MRIRALICLLFLINGIAVLPAYADIDHRCLNMCVNNGVPAARCLSSCGTGIDAAVPKIPGSATISGANKLQAPVDPTVKALNVHRLLNAPTPLGNEVLVSKSLAHTEQPTKNYQCMSQCLQQKLQYATCEQACTVGVGGNSNSLSQNSNQLPINSVGAANSPPNRAIH